MWNWLCIRPFPIRTEATAPSCLRGQGRSPSGSPPQVEWSEREVADPDRGDEGSGYWIGKELVRRSAAQKQGGIKRPRDIANVRAIAALAKQTVVRSAHDPLCAKIVQEAQSHLAALVNDIVRQLKPHASLALTWGGSLLSNPRFRKGVFLKIKSIHKKSIRFVAPPKNPVETAVLHPTCIPAKPPPLPPRK
jgi:hypothetical protein